MKRHSLAVALALAGFAVLAGATAIAAATGGDGTVYACRSAQLGFVRIVDDPDSCYRWEKAIDWNRRGPAGPPGPPGIVSMEALQGIACTTFAGQPGTVAVEVDATNRITLTCENGDSPQPPPPPPAPPPPAPGAPPTLVLNEIDYDQVGADVGGFVEVANIGAGEAVLDGLAVVLVNGDGTEYDRLPLAGSLAAGGHLALDANPQNGAPDGVALVDTGDGTLLDALSYEGEITNATIDGRVFSLVEGTPLPTSVADSNTVDGSLARLPDGADTNDAASDWGFTTTPTRGAPNVPAP